MLDAMLCQPETLKRYKQGNPTHQSRLEERNGSSDTRNQANDDVDAALGSRTSVVRARGGGRAGGGENARRSSGVDDGNTSGGAAANSGVVEVDDRAVAGADEGAVVCD